jgi:hypothetical protein
LLNQVSQDKYPTEILQSPQEHGDEVMSKDVLGRALAQEYVYLIEEDNSKVADLIHLAVCPTFPLGLEVVSLGKWFPRGSGFLYILYPPIDLNLEIVPYFPLVNPCLLSLIPSIPDLYLFSKLVRMKDER